MGWLPSGASAERCGESRKELTELLRKRMAKMELTMKGMDMVEGQDPSSTYEVRRIRKTEVVCGCNPDRSRVGRTGVEVAR